MNEFAKPKLPSTTLLNKHTSVFVRILQKIELGGLIMAHFAISEVAKQMPRRANILPIGHKTVVFGLLRHPFCEKPTTPRELAIFYSLTTAICGLIKIFYRERKILRRL